MWSERRLFPLLMAAALGLTACAGGDDVDPAPPSTTTTAPTTTVPTTTVPMTTVRVWFLDFNRYAAGVDPYFVAVERLVRADRAMDLALDALFAGPTPSETAQGLHLVASGATGVEPVRVERATALVQLRGACASGGRTVTVASHIIPTLKQFAGVTAVKIYDPAGATLHPDVPGDSTPLCLEP